MDLRKSSGGAWDSRDGTIALEERLRSRSIASGLSGRVSVSQLNVRENTFEARPASSCSGEVLLPEGILSCLHWGSTDLGFNQLAQGNFPQDAV